MDVKDALNANHEKIKAAEMIEDMEFAQNLSLDAEKTLSGDELEDSVDGLMNLAVF